MARDRYVLLGLGQARSPWFGNVAAWATSGAVPADFAKCLSVAEVRQRLNTLQPYSALLVEAKVPALDRDLIEAAKRSGVPTFVVDSSPGRAKAWLDLGAAVVLPADLDPSELLAALSTFASVISPRTELDNVGVIENITARRGTLITVCGPGGTGSSTVAIAISQGIASDVVDFDLVVLADLARYGEQAMLHDAPDVVPGIEELVDSHRLRRCTVEEIRDMTYAVHQRGYRLLLGQRKPAAWATLPPKAIDASVAGLRRAFRTVVADVTADFEGESDGGSIDVEERNALARNAAVESDLVVVVGLPGMKGVHSLSRCVRDVLGLGIDAGRVLVVVNRAPNKGSRRAEISRALASLVHLKGAPVQVAPPVFLPDRPLEAVLHDGAPLPKQVTDQVTTAVAAMLERSGIRGDIPTSVADPEPVEPGSLGIRDSAAGE